MWIPSSLLLSCVWMSPFAVADNGVDEPVFFFYTSDSTCIQYDDRLDDPGLEGNGSMCAWQPSRHRMYSCPARDNVCWANSETSCSNTSKTCSTNTDGGYSWCCNGMEYCPRVPGQINLCWGWFKNPQHNMTESEAIAQAQHTSLAFNSAANSSISAYLKTAPPPSPTTSSRDASATASGGDGTSSLSTGAKAGVGVAVGVGVLGLVALVASAWLLLLRRRQQQWENTLLQQQQQNHDRPQPATDASAAYHFAHHQQMQQQQPAKSEAFNTHPSGYPVQEVQELQSSPREELQAPERARERLELPGDRPPLRPLWRSRSKLIETGTSRSV